jgi:hypothetical protein
MRFKVLLLGAVTTIQNKSKPGLTTDIETFSCEDDSGKKYDNCKYFNSSGKRLAVGDYIYGNFKEKEYNGEKQFHFSKENNQKRSGFSGGISAEGMKDLTKAILIASFANVYSNSEKNASPEEAIKKAYSSGMKVYKSLSTEDKKE